MIEKSHIVKKEKKKRETGSCPSSARLNRVPLLNRRGTFKSRIAADLFLSPPCITLMPLTTRYLTAAPHDVVRHILTCQIAVAFLTCFLTIITIHSSLYRVASSPLKVRHQALSPCVIVTATDNPLVLKSFFATMSMDIQQRPPIIAYTSNISHVNRDDLQHVMSKDDQLVVAQQRSTWIISTAWWINWWTLPISTTLCGWILHRVLSVGIWYNIFVASWMNMMDCGLFVNLKQFALCSVLIRVTKQFVAWFKTWHYHCLE